MSLGGSFVCCTCEAPTALPAAGTCETCRSAVEGCSDASVCQRCALLHKTSRRFAGDAFSAAGGGNLATVALASFGLTPTGTYCKVPRHARHLITLHCTACAADPFLCGLCVPDHGRLRHADPRAVPEVAALERQRLDAALADLQQPVAGGSQTDGAGGAVPRATRALLARLDADLEGVEPALAAARRAVLDAEATIIAAVQTQCAAISKEMGSAAAARTAALAQTRNAVLASLGSLEAAASGLGDIVTAASDVDIVAHAPALAARARSLLDSSAELVASEEPRVQQAQESTLGWSPPGVAGLSARVAVLETAIENLGREAPGDDTEPPQLWPPAAVLARQPFGAVAAAAAGLRPVSSQLDVSRASSSKERGASLASPGARLSQNSSSDLSGARGGGGERGGVFDHSGGRRSPPPRVAFAAPDVSSSFDDSVVVRLLVRRGARGPAAAAEGALTLPPAAAAAAGDCRPAGGLVGGPRTGA